eukprot:9026264-Ditylum_brightwellii.AAC.2
MENTDMLQRVADEQYGSCKNEATGIQALNTRLYNNFVLLERAPTMSTFIDLVSNYDLIVYSIALIAP